MVHGRPRHHGRGCITVPAYITNTTRDHEHILDDSGARAVIVSNQKLATPLLPAALRSNSCEHVIGMTPIRTASRGAVTFHEWAALIASETPDVAACAAGANFAADDMACIIYTSGTGGAPRGVMQHHGAILHNVEGCIDVISVDYGWDDEVFLSFLPPATPTSIAAGNISRSGSGAQIYYSEGLEKLASNIEEVRPTLMVVVPRCSRCCASAS
jgi:long-chain acyl-CoA synthetase